MAKFNHSGNFTTFKSELGRLSRRVPFGAKNLLPAWKQTVSLSALGATRRDPKGTVYAQLRANLVTYLNSRVGVDINVVKSRARQSSDRLLRFNGKL